ncbi:hypothetical protein B0H14DRAFT_2639759 [Mycena olivaceomarginata]|nr:hypothetical protein B0H14DRAFT_2639759 [Mycena olivaceomarginata]
MGMTVKESIQKLLRKGIWVAVATSRRAFAITVCFTGTGMWCTVLSGNGIQPSSGDLTWIFQALDIAPEFRYTIAGCYCRSQSPSDFPVGREDRGRGIQEKQEITKDVRHSYAHVL